MTAADPVYLKPIRARVYTVRRERPSPVCVMKRARPLRQGTMARAGARHLPEQSDRQPGTPPSCRVAPPPTAPAPLSSRTDARRRPGRLRAPRPRGRTCGCARPRCGAGPAAPMGRTVPKGCLLTFLRVSNAFQIQKVSKIIQIIIKNHRKIHIHRLYFDL